MESHPNNNTPLKGLITATRMSTVRAITNTTNKHLIPLANKPIILYAVEKLSSLGVQEIGIVISKGEKDIQRTLGNGSKWNVTFSYITQEEDNLGIAFAIHSARSFLGESPFVLHLGDTIILDDLTQARDYFLEHTVDCLLLLAKTKNAQQFGVPVFDKKGAIVKIEERPVNPASSFAVCGVYFYKPIVHTLFAELQPSQRGVYEISDMHTHLAQKKYSLQYQHIHRWWKDRGIYSDLLVGNQLLCNTLSQRASRSFEHTVQLEGVVSIDPSSKISGNTIIRGPAIIGSHCLIHNSYIGPYSSIGNDVELHNAKIENSIVFEGATITTPTPITNSIIGKKTSITNAPSPLTDSYQFIVGDNSTIYI